MYKCRFHVKIEYNIFFRWVVSNFQIFMKPNNKVMQLYVVLKFYVKILCHEWCEWWLRELLNYEKVTN